MFDLTIVFSSVFNYLVDAYREWSASAMAANTFLRCVMAGGFPLFAVQVLNLGFSRLSLDVQSTGIRLGRRITCFPMLANGAFAIHILLLGRDITPQEQICKKLRRKVIGDTQLRPHETRGSIGVI
jgi:hypothetical protein